MCVHAMACEKSSEDSCVKSVLSFRLYMAFEDLTQVIRCERQKCPRCLASPDIHVYVYLRVYMYTHTQTHIYCYCVEWVYVEVRGHLCGVCSLLLLV